MNSVNININFLIYKIYYIIFIISTNSFYISSYILSDIRSYGILKLMLVYSTLNLCQIFLHLTHLYKIIKYYGKRISEPVWWNLENYANIWLYMLLRIPCFTSLILGIVMCCLMFPSFYDCGQNNRFDNKEMTNTLECASLRIISLISACEFVLYVFFTFLPECICINIRSLILESDKFSNITHFIFRTIKNYLTNLLPLKNHCESYTRCCICWLKVSAQDLSDHCTWLGISCSHDHIIHAHCFEEWIKYNLYCPMCCEDIIIDHIADIIIEHPRAQTHSQERINMSDTIVNISTST